MKVRKPVQYYAAKLGIMRCALLALPLFVSSTSFAVNVLPGGGTQPFGVTIQGNPSFAGKQAASMTHNFQIVLPSNQGTIKGTVREWLIATTTHLDFYAQIYVDPASAPVGRVSKLSVENVAANLFPSTPLDMDYVIDSGDGTVAKYVFRDSTGFLCGYDFSDGMGPSMKSRALFYRTQARSYDTHGVMVISAFTNSGPGGMYSAVVPAFRPIAK